MNKLKNFTTFLEAKNNNMFSTLEEKKAFIKSGNIITFKGKIPNFPSGQIAISEIKKNKEGEIKLINPFGKESAWYKESDLLDAIDWKWMEQNIVVKKYESSKNNKFELTLEDEYNDYNIKYTILDDEGDEIEVSYSGTFIEKEDGYEDYISNLGNNTMRTFIEESIEEELHKKINFKFIKFIN